MGGGGQGGLGGGGGFGGGGQGGFGGGGGGGQGFFNVAPEMLMMNSAPPQKAKAKAAPQGKAAAQKPEIKPIQDGEMKAILDGILGETEPKSKPAQFHVQDKPFQFN